MYYIYICEDLSLGLNNCNGCLNKLTHIAIQIKPGMYVGASTYTYTIYVQMRIPAYLSFVSLTSQRRQHRWQPTSWRHRQLVLM